MVKRRCFLAMAISSISGCLSQTSKTNSEEEINHEENDPEYLGTHESHEIGFSTIDYVSETASQDKIFLEFREEPPSNTAVHVFFYNENEIVGAGSQDLERFPFNDREGEHIQLPSPSNMKEFSAYRIAVIQGTGESDENESNMVSPSDVDPREYCEDEDVAPEEDDPTKPNCNQNPYGSGQTEYNTQYLRPIEGLPTIRED